MPKIKAICISHNKGPKTPVKKAVLIEDYGIQNDFHAKKGSLRQVSFLSEEIIEEVKKEGLKITEGNFGENIILSGINIKNLQVGGIIVIGNKVKLKITKIGKECPSPCIIYKTLGKCIMPEYGVFAKVLTGGEIKIEDSCNYN